MGNLALYLLVGILLTLASQGAEGDGSRDHGEECSLRSQVANFFRASGEKGCISAKGLICMSHKCSCSPTSVYETPPPPSSSSDSDSGSSSLSSSAMSFFKKLVRGGSSSSTTTTTPPPPPATATGTGGAVTGGRCAGRAGSPCLNKDSFCVQHAACLGTPISLCGCQGLYSSNAQGFCSKSATVATQALKGITTIFSGK